MSLNAMQTFTSMQKHATRLAVWGCSGRGVLRRRVLIGGVMALSACHGLLDVSDPTLIRDQDVANAAGANSRRLGVISTFAQAAQSAAVDVSFFSDERGFDRDYTGANGQNPVRTDVWDLDIRDGANYESRHNIMGDDPHLANLVGVVTAAAVAIPQVRQYAAAAVKDDYLGQMYAFRGYAILQLAEDLCPGFPINDVSANNNPIYSQPYSTDAAALYAVTQLDSALAHAHDSVTYLNLARVVKGRALLDLGKYPEAAAAVAAVPDDFVYTTDLISYYSPSIGNKFFVNFDPSDPWDFEGYPIGNGEGINGLRFVSENDVRVPTVYKRRRIVDTTQLEYEQQKYPTLQSALIVASGTEARLIEAEAALHDAPGSSEWLDILNRLRTTAGLPDLPDRGTATLRLDDLYHERGFWLYLTGRRLGDLRRLIRNYNRTPETVFPTGLYPLGDSYGTATAIPFVFGVEARYNHNITAGCTAR